MTIAVTAVSGQLGAEVVRSLAELGTDEPILGLARTPANAPDLGIEVRPGDYADIDQLQSSLEGVDALLLVSGNGDPGERVALHRNVLAAATAAGVSKVVFTSVQGAEEGTGFNPVITSTRQTEADVRDSGLDWVIGRNGIYIEPDIASIEDYVAAGEVVNSAGDGRVGYTTRPELAHAYARMLTEPTHNGHTYRLHGQPMSQAELVGFMNQAFDTELVYRPMSVDDYRDDRTTELGEFMGSLIAGIYEGIHTGALDVPSDFEAAAGRPHERWDDYFASLVR